MRTRTASLIDGVLAAASTAAVAGYANGVPTSGFWRPVHNHATWLPVALLVFTAVFAVLTPISRIVGKGRVSTRLRVTNEILAALGSLESAARSVTPNPFDVGSVSIHIWLVSHPAHALFRARLRRVGNYRLSHSAQQLPFSPSKGVGVIGLCWKRDQALGVDVGSLVAALSDESAFDALRQAQGDDAVMNLSWSKFCDVSHLGAIYAVPLRKGDRFVGCISADAPNSYSQLETPMRTALLELSHRLDVDSLTELP